MHACVTGVTLHGPFALNKLVARLQLLPYLQGKGVGVISAAPLCMGLWRSQASSGSCRVTMVTCSSRVKSMRVLVADLSIMA
jgi:hypothetical protein